MDPLKISGVDRGKESKYGKGGVEVTALITYKTPLAVNGKPVTVSTTLGENVACNIIF